MRFLSQAPLLLAGLVLLVAAQDADLNATPAALEEPATTETVAAVPETESEKSTVFNGQKVPPMKAVGGKDLDELIKNGNTVVKFFSPQCHHCLHVAPFWQTIYEFYWTSKPLPLTPSTDQSMNDFHHYYDYDFASVDCLAFGDTCQKWDASSYPTFILFKDGKDDKRMTGAKDMSGLSEFVEETLEIIRPGSRVLGGPELPDVGAKVSPGFDPALLEQAVQEPSKQKPIESSTTAKGKKKKPTKQAAMPNSLGKSMALTAESFQSLVTMSQEPWFIKFYAPWCHHCKAMAPNWEQLSKEMKGKLNIGEVNCEVETRLCKEIHLRGYPTILFFRGGERVEYDGLRGLGDFISYANNAISSGGGVRDVSAAEFKKMEEKEDVIFVYFYDHATTSEDFAALERLTLSLIGHAKLVKTDDVKLAERFKITTWPRLMVSRNGRPTYYTALSPPEMRDIHRVLQWMQSVWLPIVPELTASNSREIMDGKLVVLAILSRDRPDEFIIAKNEIKSAALEWMDKQTHFFQLERQELRDAKQLRIEEAEARNDQRALRSAKTIRINMDKSHRKEVSFAWVDGVFWERWIRTTFGIEVSDGEKVIINDEDNRRYWDTTITGNFIMASRTSILETIPKVVASPPKIKPKLTISNFEKVLFDIRGAASEHPFMTIGLIAGIVLAGIWYGRGRRSRRGGFFRLDEKDGFGLLGSNINGKVD